MKKIFTDEPIIINDESDVRDHEIAILQSKIDHDERKSAQYKLEIELEKKKNEQEKELNNRLYAALSKRVGFTVDQNNIDSIKLPKDISGEVLDEVFDKQNCLIRPSNETLPFSLINKKPELIDYVPFNGPRSNLELLTKRSASRSLEVINTHTSENTLRAHNGDLVYMHAWLSAVGFTFKGPISEKFIIAFIVQHAEEMDSDVDQKLVAQGYKAKLGPHKLSTIKRRIGSLSVFMDSLGWENPCHNATIKKLLFKYTKMYGGSKPTGKAITKDILDDMLDTCKEDKKLDLRDRALLLFAWGSGGRRRTEVSSADMKDLTRIPDDEFTYTIPKSKTDQEGKGFVVPVKGRVAKALNDWLSVSGVTEGAIFRSVKKGGHIGRPLSDIDVYRIVKLRLKKAGYDEKLFGAHSLRSGFVTEAGKRQKPLGDVMAMTTHKNVGTVMKYYQSGNIINNSAANLAD